MAVLKRKEEQNRKAHHRNIWKDHDPKTVKMTLVVSHRMKKCCKLSLQEYKLRSMALGNNPAIIRT